MTLHTQTLLWPLLWRQLSALAILLAISFTAGAQIQPLLNLPATPVAAAHRIQVSIVFVNNGERIEALKPLPSLPAVLQVNGEPHLLRLVRAPHQARPPAHLRPGEAYPVHYLTELPAGLPHGVFTLTLADHPQHPAFLVVGTHTSGLAAGADRTTAPGAIEPNAIAQDATADTTAASNAGQAAAAACVPAADRAYAASAPAAPDTASQAADTAPLIEVVPSAESVDEEAQRNVFLGNFYTYEPLYFLFGTNSSNAKFQISFKYRFIDDDSEFAQRHPWLSNFYVAYTQTSFWDLASESAPFRDTNFKPEVFYQFNDVRLPFISDNAYFDFRTGYQHESNGQEGDDSRSLNIVYLEPAFHWNIFGDYQFSLAPRVWTYVGGRDGNQDIRDFRGRSSLTATLTRDGGFQAEAMLRGNPGDGNGSLQVDLSYPLSALSFFNLDFYLYGQFFTGYGESLLDFNRKDTRFRLGLGLAR